MLRLQGDRLFERSQLPDRGPREAAFSQNEGRHRDRNGRGGPRGRGGDRGDFDGGPGRGRSRVGIIHRYVILCADYVL